jgi:hypothetical protein
MVGFVLPSSESEATTARKVPSRRAWTPPPPPPPHIDEVISEETEDTQLQAPSSVRTATTVPLTVITDSPVSYEAPGTSIEGGTPTSQSTVRTPVTSGRTTPIEGADYEITTAGGTSSTRPDSHRSYDYPGHFRDESVPDSSRLTGESRRYPITEESGDETTRLRLDEFAKQIRARYTTQKSLPGSESSFQPSQLDTRRQADDYLRDTPPPYTRESTETAPCTGDEDAESSRGSNKSVLTDLSVPTSRSGGSSAWQRQRDCSCPIGRTCKFCADVCSSIGTGISTSAKFALDLMMGQKHVTSAVLSGTSSFAGSVWSATKAGASSVAQSSFGRSVIGSSMIARDAGSHIYSETCSYQSRRASEIGDGARLMMGAKPLHSYTGKSSVREKDDVSESSNRSGGTRTSVFSRLKRHLRGRNCSTGGDGGGGYALI